MRRWLRLRQHRFLRTENLKQTLEFTPNELDPAHLIGTRGSRPTNTSTMNESGISVHQTNWHRPADGARVSAIVCRGGITQLVLIESVRIAVATFRIPVTVVTSWVVRGATRIATAAAALALRGPRTLALGVGNKESKKHRNWEFLGRTSGFSDSLV